MLQYWSSALLIIAIMFICFFHTRSYLEHYCNLDAVSNSTAVSFQSDSMTCRADACKEGFVVWNGKCMRECDLDKVPRAIELRARGDQCYVVRCEGEDNIDTGEGWWPSPDRTTCIHMKSGEECQQNPEKPETIYRFNNQRECSADSCRKPWFWKDGACARAGDSCGARSIYRYDEERQGIDCTCKDGYGGEECNPEPTWIKQYTDPLCPGLWTASCKSGETLSDECPDPEPQGGDSCDPCKVEVLIQLTRNELSRVTKTLPWSQDPIDIEIFFHGRRPDPGERFLVSTIDLPRGMALRLWEDIEPNKDPLLSRYREIQGPSNIAVQGPSDTTRYRLIQLIRQDDVTP